MPATTPDYNEVKRAVKRITTAYPRFELKIIFNRATRDMSVGNLFKKEKVIPYGNIYPGAYLDTSGLDGGRVRAVSKSEEMLELLYEDTHYKVELGGEVDSKHYAVSNPYLSYQEEWYTFEFNYVSLMGKMWQILKGITTTYTRFHSNPDGATAFDKAVVLQLLDCVLAEDGDEEPHYYLLKAILHASDNWSTGEFVRPELFKKLLLKGIGHGALKPDDTEGWDWMRVAADNNDPADFIDDKDLYFDLLSAAAEEDNETARNIRDRIWPPEQTLEED